MGREPGGVGVSSWQRSSQSDAQPAQSPSHPLTTEAEPKRKKRVKKKKLGTVEPSEARVLRCCCSPKCRHLLPIARAHLTLCSFRPSLFNIYYSVEQMLDAVLIDMAHGTWQLFSSIISALLHLCLQVGSTSDRINIPRGRYLFHLPLAMLISAHRLGRPSRGDAYLTAGRVRHLYLLLSRGHARLLCEACTNRTLALCYRLTNSKHFKIVALSCASLTYSLRGNCFRLQLSPDAAWLSTVGTVCKNPATMQ